MKFSTLGAIVAVVTALVIPGPVQADPERCSSAINKEFNKYIKTRSKVLEKCKRNVLTKGEPATLGECPDAKGAGKIASSASKMRSKIEKKCGGGNKICSADDFGSDADESLASINWDIGRCMNFEGGSHGSCVNAIADCGDVADCLECIANAGIDQEICDLLYDGFNPTKFFLSSGDVTRVERRCQRTVAQESVKFVQKKQRLLEKCWDSKLKGKAGFDDADPCPDTDPKLGSSGDNKTVEKIKRLQLKLVDKICRKCGGDGDSDRDGLCDESDAVVSGGVAVTLPDIITLPFECPAVVVPPDAVHPGGWDCGAIGSPAPNVTTLQEYIDCVSCVSEFKVDCMGAAGVGDGNPALGIEFPGGVGECNACVADVTGEACPAIVQIDPDGGATNLDSGWTGLSHDFDLPTGGRLTMGVTGCAGSERPTCGECTLDGPVTNAGGKAFSNQRCAGDGSYFECTDDLDCTNESLLGPCVFFFGPPLPQSSGGVPICITNQIDGAITGTVNVESGEMETTVNLTARAHSGIFLELPCPVCEEGVCSGGSRFGQACTVGGRSTLFGNLSLDCPPNSGGVIGRLPISLSSATGITTRTLSAANPDCRAIGFSTAKCFCSTCDDGTNTPCGTDADCGGGVCGGPRCLGGTNAGGACGAPSDCPGGGQCGVPGQPTAPNACLDATCVDNPGDTDTIDEGVCGTGPFDTFCSIDVFRSCTADAQCQDPLCPTCTPGQTCTAGFRECFTDNGVIGGDVSVEGAADIACTNSARPALGSLFCIPPTAESAPNAVGGLPSLGRLSLPVDLTFDP